MNLFFADRSEMRDINQERMPRNDLNWWNKSKLRNCCFSDPVGEAMMEFSRFVKMIEKQVEWT
jgi:hypothetical protein